PMQVTGVKMMSLCLFFFSSRRRHTRFSRDWSSDVCSSDLVEQGPFAAVQTFATDRAHTLLLDLFQHVVHQRLDLTAGATAGDHRSEERRVGQECRCRWAE